MINAEKLLGKIVKQSLKKGLRGKKGITSMIPGGLTGIAGLGALGVAIAAFDHFTQKRQQPQPGVPPGPPPPSGTATGRTPPPPPPPPASTDLPGIGQPPPAGGLQSEALLLIRAMIAAANADGNIDPEERKKILQHLREAGITPEEERFIVQELNSPPSIDSLLPSITTPELAAEVYTVSLLAIDADSRAEKAYLGYLKARLNLDEAKVKEIHDQLDRAGNSPV